MAEAGGGGAAGNWLMMAVALALVVGGFIVGALVCLPLIGIPIF